MPSWLSEYLPDHPGWLTYAACFLVSMLALWSARRLIEAASRNVKAADNFPNILATLARKINWLLIVALALVLANVFSPRSLVWQKRIDHALIIAGALQAAIWVGMLIETWASRQQRKRLPSAAGSLGLVSVGFKIGLWVAIALFALNNLGVNITALVAGLGIGGIAAGLALQNILGDLFASLAIVLDEPFLVGDFIVFGDEAGTIESIGLKTTRLRSLNGEQIVCSNSDLLNSRIRNYKRMQQRRVQFALGVSFETPPATLKTIANLVAETISRQANVRFDRSHFKEIGAYSMNFEVVYWVLSAEYGTYMDIQQTINIELLEMFSGIGVELAYPTQALRFVEMAKAA